MGKDLESNLLLKTSWRDNTPFYMCYERVPSNANFDAYLRFCLHC